MEVLRIRCPAPHTVPHLASRDTTLMVGIVYISIYYLFNHNLNNNLAHNIVYYISIVPNF